MAKQPFRRDDSYDEPVNVDMDPEDAVRAMLESPQEAVEPEEE